MRLFVDCHVFDGKFQGTRTYLQGLYTEMVKHRDIDFYFAAQDTDNLARVFGRADHIHYVKFEQEGSVARLFWEIPRLMTRLKIDYAHFQYVSPLVKRCKEIVTVHDLLFMDFPEYFPWTYRVKNKAMFLRSAKRADLLLTVSEFSRARIATHFGLDRERIFVTYNSVLPMEEGTPLPDVRKLLGLDKFILCVGRVEPRKNFLMLAKAFVELGLHNEGYKLVFVGAKDLGYKAFFDYLAGLPKEVSDCILMKAVPFDQLVALYKQASLFVYPSLAEGFGIPPIEAVVYDCPLLCSNATAMAEFGLPEEAYFDPHDLDELKRKMRRKLDAGRETGTVKNDILEVFNWKNSANVLYKALFSKK
jgi:glycosyltransferase involved in cell wall biosynthesis